MKKLSFFHTPSCILPYLKDLPLAGYFLLYIIFSPRMNM